MLIEELVKFAEELESKYSDINLGGCGVVAAEMCEALSKVVDKVEVIYQDYNKQDNRPHVAINKAVKTNDTITLSVLSDNRVDCNHAIIKFKYNGRWYKFDSEGVMYYTEFKTLNKRYRHCKIPLEVAKEIIESPEGWNSTFNRSQIPAIQESIHNFVEGLQL